jgi:hypothetical protein
MTIVSLELTWCSVTNSLRATAVGSKGRPKRPDNVPLHTQWRRSVRSGSESASYKVDKGLGLVVG